MADSRSTIKGLRARLDALGVPHGRISTGAALRVAIEEEAAGGGGATPGGGGATPHPTDADGRAAVFVRGVLR